MNEETKIPTKFSVEHEEFVDELDSYNHGYSALEALGKNVEILMIDNDGDYRGTIRIIGKDHETSQIIDLQWNFGSCDACDHFWLKYRGVKNEKPLIVADLREKIKQYASIRELLDENKDKVKDLHETKYMSNDDLARNVSKFILTEEEQRVARQLKWRLEEEEKKAKEKKEE